MKKLIAMIVSVVMLLSMAVVMPVMADAEVNLIVNGDFETVDSESATNISGWTQEGEYGNKYFEQSTALRTSTTAEPFGTLESTAAVYTVNTAETWAAGRLTQTVTFDDGSDYYTYYPAYSYVLSMDVYVGSTAYRGNLELTVTGADGTTATQTVNYVYDAEKQWQMNSQSFNISELVADTIGDQAIKSIKIGLVGKGNSQCIAYDNVKLTPVFDATKLPADATTNLIQNGDFIVTGESATDIPGWTQEGEYGNKNFEQGTALRTAVGNDPFASLASTAAIYTVNTAETWAAGRLTQTVTFDEDSEYYQQYYAYSYVLSMDVYVGSTAYRGNLELTVTGEDGTVYSQTLQYVYDAEKQWQMNRQSFNISELIADTIGVQPIKSIKIGLVGKGNNQCIAYDNVKLIPSFDENATPPAEEEDDTLNLIANGSFETVTDGVIANWEQTNADIPYSIQTTGATKGRNRIYYKNLADHAYPGVKQEITIDKSAEWYTNQEKYRYMLTFDGLVGGLRPTGIVEVTVTDGDGFKKSAVYAGGTDFGTDLTEYWVMKDFELDLSNIIDAAESKVEKIEITLRNNNWVNGEMAWDNVKLTPVYDENKVVPEKELNLIKNGGFEYVEDGELLIWEQTNADIPYIIQATGATEGLNRIYYKNLADHAYPGVKQEITIDKSAEWYTNQEKYRYMLTFDGLVGGLTPTGIVEVTVTDGDGFKKSAVYAGGTDFGTNLTEYWVMKDFELDLSNIIDAADSKVEKIEITLRNNNWINGEMAWDNVKLAPVYDEDKVVEKELNLLKNGGFEYFDENGLLIWEQTNADALYNHYKNGDTYDRVSNGEVVRQQTWNSSTEGMYAIHYINYADNAYAGVKQTVTFGADDAWFTNQDKHRFILSFDGLIAGVLPTGAVAVTAYDAEGVASTVIFRGGQDYGTEIADTEYWTMINFSIDISEVLDALETDAVKVDIELRNNTHINGEMAWDNVKLTPVYDADKVVPVNLVVNGTFEKDEAGSTEFASWTQTGDAEIVFTVSEEAEIGKVAKYDASATPGAVASLTQTITMDTEADWYKDFRNYRYILSYDSYAPGSAYRGYVQVTVTGANGVTATTQYAFPYPVEAGDQWKMNTFTRDLKDFIETGIGIQPVKSLDVVLVGTHPNGGIIFYDNVKLYAEYVKPTTEKNYAVNPGFEEMDGDTLVGWTFSGADQEEVLGMDGAGTEGNNYIALPVGAYADLTLSGEQLPAGAAYLIQFDYKQLGAGGEMKIENPAQGNEEMFSVKYGEATGTSEETAVWKNYKDIIVLSENDTQGARILLRNTDVANNEYVFYDNIKITRINGYDMENLIKNGSFEAGASNGSTSIPGWTHTVEGKPGNLVETEEGYELYLPAGLYAVNQTVAIKDYDTMAGQNHGYKLEYDVYGNYHKFTIKVAFENPDGDDIVFPIEVSSIRSNEFDENGMYLGPESEPLDTPIKLDEKTYVVADLNVLTHVEYDLTWIAQMLPNPIKSINIEFSSMGSTSNIDNVRLICRKNSFSVLDGDSNVVNKIETAEDVSLKAKLRCYTDVENAKVYFAVYDKAEDGTLTMKGITIAPLTGDGEEKTAETDFVLVDTIKGETVIHAVIWGGNNKMTPIAKYTIE